MFDKFSPFSKVWIYQSSVPFAEQEIVMLNTKLAAFSKQWTAHNQQLQATGKVIEDRFILLMVDESQNDASGCSIDKSVHFLKSIEQELSVELFNRKLVSFRNGSTIETVELSFIPHLLAQGSINENSLVYNTLVQTKQEFNDQFLVPLHNSWVKQFV